MLYRHSVQQSIVVRSTVMCAKLSVLIFSTLLWVYMIIGNLVAPEKCLECLRRSQDENLPSFVLNKDI